MRIRQIEYLVKTVECGSITKAAKELYISQPSLTKMISGLEEEYGMRILKRSTKGVELTEEGRNFLHYCRNVLSAVDMLDHNFRKKSVKANSRLFLAFQQLDFMYELVYKVWQKNMDRDIHYILIETNRADVVDRVLSRDADLGLLVGNALDGKSVPWKLEAGQLEMFLLEKMPVYACVGPNSPLYGQSFITFAQARDYPSLVLDMGMSEQKSCCIDNRDENFNKDRIVFVNTSAACQYFLLHTDAVLYISKWTRGCFSDRRIRVLPVRGDEENGAPSCNELFLIKRAGEYLSRTEEQFAGELREYFGNASDCFLRE